MEDELIEQEDRVKTLLAELLVWLDTSKKTAAAVAFGERPSAKQNWRQKSTTQLALEATAACRLPPTTSTGDFTQAVSACPARSAGYVRATTCRHGDNRAARVIEAIRCPTRGMFRRTVELYPRP